LDDDDEEEEVDGSDDDEDDDEDIAKAESGSKGEVGADEAVAKAKKEKASQAQHDGLELKKTILDTTRVHPRDWVLAEQICRRFCEMNQRGEGNEQAIAYCLQRVKTDHDPSWLERRQKDLFQTFIRRQTVHIDPDMANQGLTSDKMGVVYEEFCGRNGSHKLFSKTVAFIIEELRFPFGERRDPFRKPTDQDLLMLYSGEEYAKVGSEIAFQVTAVVRLDDRPPRQDSPDGDRVRVNAVIQGRTNGGLRVQMKLLDGDIVPRESERFRTLSYLLRQISSARPHEIDAMLNEINSHLATEFAIREGAMLEGKVLDVSRTPFRVALKLADITTADSILDDLGGKPTTWDEYFQPIDLRNGSGNDQYGPSKPLLPFRPRNIPHPIFQNLTEQQAEAFLSHPDKKVGDCVLRPSSRGFHLLNLTWRWSNEPARFETLPIEEKMFDGSLKDQNDPAIGGKLIMKGREYDAIDEILALYIEPISKRIRELQQHKYYRNSSIEEIEGLIRDQRLRNPQSIPYYFVVHKSEKRTFYLAYQNTNVAPKRFRVVARPEGLDLVNRHGLRNINELVDYFKRHVKELEEANMRKTHHAAGSRWGAEVSSTSVLPPMLVPSAGPGMMGHFAPVAAQQQPFAYPSNPVPSGAAYGQQPAPLPPPFAYGVQPVQQQPQALQPPLRSHRNPVVYE
jgi:hypothetical protein